jgi:hypothetical protein
MLVWYYGIMEHLVKTTKLSTVFSRFAALMCLGVFAFAGCVVANGQFSVSQLQEHPLSLQVPVFQQSRSTSCGEAVITMTYNYAHPEAPLTEQEVIEYALANGYFTEAVSPFTSPENMVKIAEYYSDDVSTGTVTSSGQGLSLLVDNLLDGAPVVIDVLSDFSDPQSEAHFVVVTGLSVDASRDNAVIIHYNDPLTGTKETADWLGDEGVWNAWITNQDPGGPGWWLVISPP